MPASRFTLRPAVEQDSQAIRDLIRRTRINPWGLDWHRFLVAVDADGRFVGCGQLKPHARGVIELASIAVEKDHRGQGVARAIIDRLIAEGPRPLFLTCRSSLGPMYEKWGFREVPSAEMPAYFRRLASMATLIKALAIANERLLVMMLK